jgi:hypothetical protein
MKGYGYPQRPPSPFRTVQTLRELEIQIGKYTCPASPFRIALRDHPPSLRMSIAPPDFHLVMDSKSDPVGFIPDLYRWLLPEHATHHAAD